MNSQRLATPRLRICLALAFAGASLSVQANECGNIADNSQRLACYDKAFRPKPATPAAAAVGAASLSGTTTPPAEIKANDDKRQAEAAQPSYATSKMIDDWDLAPDTTHTQFELRTYKPTYLLLGTYTDSINRQPTSDNSANSLSAPLDLKATEAQFQLSFKTKVFNNIFGNNGSLWVGYTQSSRWQIYNSGLSRPFRETNYEPEAMLIFRTPLELGGWNLRMSGIGLAHQSNGRANPLSRSWNRVIAQFGIEHKDLSIQVRPWWRIPESDQNDNNPGIENYIGRGEVTVAQRLGEHIVSLQGRHSLRGGDQSRGSIKLDWAIPIAGRLKGHLSAFSGYGESLIDYNHRQTMIGVGISLVDW